MNRLAIFISALIAALLLGACGKEAQPVVVEAAPGAKNLLAHVPSETPYMVANLQPIPEDVLDANFERLQPVLKEMQTQLSGLKSQVSMADSTMTGDEVSDRILLALLEELDGNLNRSGLQSLGWDLQSTSVVYGNGVFPVARIGLADAAVLRATILRVIENAGIDASDLEYQGVSYWRIEAADNPEVPFAFYVSILPDHLALAAHPMTEEASFLPAFLGLELPAENGAAERLSQINAEHGYTPYGSGYLDLHRLADEITDPESITAKVLVSSGEMNMDRFSEVCAAETHRIVDNMPIVTGGVTEMAVKAMQYRVVASMPGTLANRMTGLVASIPAARTLSDHLAELSFGIKVGAVRDFIREKAQAVVDAPFQCDHYADLNKQAEDVLVKMDQPMPPFVNNFRGVRASLKELVFEPGQDLPKDIRGHLAVHVDEPQMFVGMAQMFLPDLSEMQLAPGDEPSRVPEFLISYQGVEAWAAMSDEAIGLSVGAGEQNTLVGFLELDAEDEGLFFSADYDNAAWYDYQSKNMPTPGNGHPMNPAMAISEAAIEAMKEAGDRNHVEMRFTPDGLVIDSRMTFK